MDEAGRGCLAGPLVAAGVLFDFTSLTVAERRALTGLDDSKRVEAAERDRLFDVISSAAATVSVIVIEPAEVDSRGLHRCNLEALASALIEVVGPQDSGPGAKVPSVSGEEDCGGGGSTRDHTGTTTCLVDGFRLDGCRVEHTSIERGDSKSAAIAAASVIAKVTRDRIMREADQVCPGWGFADHVGYGTPDHLDAIRRLGPSPLHRLSFNCSAYPPSQQRLA